MYIYYLIGKYCRNNIIYKNYIYIRAYARCGLRILKRKYKKKNKMIKLENK